MILLPEAILMMMELVVSVRKEECLLRNWVSEAGGVCGRSGGNSCATHDLASLFATKQPPYLRV